MNSIVFILLAVIVKMTIGMSVTNAPCFMNDSGRLKEQNQMDMTSLQYILDQIRNLAMLTKNRLDKMTIDYCVDEKHEDESFLKRKLDNITDTEQFHHEYIWNITSFLTSIREHYDMLNLANYLQELTSIIDETTAQDSMFLVQNHIYNVMCPMKKVLRSQDKDPQCKVPSGKVSDTVHEYRQQKRNIRNDYRCMDQTLEYVTIHDCYRVAKYLETLYINITSSHN